MRGGDSVAPFFCFAASRCFLSFEAALAFNMLSSPSATAKLKGLFDFCIDHPNLAHAGFRVREYQR